MSTNGLACSRASVPGRAVYVRGQHVETMTTLAESGNRYALKKKLLIICVRTVPERVDFALWAI